MISKFIEICLMKTLMVLLFFFFFNILPTRNEKNRFHINTRLGI